jgi:hypothetical protein
MNVPRFASSHLIMPATSVWETTPSAMAVRDCGHRVEGNREIVVADLALDDDRGEVDPLARKEGDGQAGVIRVQRRNSASGSRAKEIIRSRQAGFWMGDRSSIMRSRSAAIINLRGRWSSNKPIRWSRFVSCVLALFPAEVEIAFYLPQI